MKKKDISAKDEGTIRVFEAERRGSREIIARQLERIYREIKER